MKLFIASNKNGASRIALNEKTRKFSSAVYENVGDSARINSLAVVVDSLKEIQEKDVPGLHVVYAPGVMADAVTDGYFKYWLVTGTNSKGEEIAQEELALWTEFAELYQAMYTNVIVKNIKKASLPKTRRYKVTADQETDNQLQAKAWENLPKVSNETAEVSEDELFG